MLIRPAAVEDLPAVAAMNLQLIRDEGHRNPMQEPELLARLQGWLLTDYQAFVFCEQSDLIGYALYRTEPEHIYLRQFFVRPEYRRKGLGRSAFQWLMKNDWNSRRIRLDVLVGNAAGRAFWKWLGFSEYCVTMELVEPE